MLPKLRFAIFAWLVVSIVTVAAALAAGPIPVTFNHPREFAAGKDPNSGAIADFNHDGKPDVAVLSRSGSVSILLNNGSGFAAPVTYAAGSAQGSMAVADLNQDGNSDIAVVDGSASIYVLLGNGDGTFQAASTISLPSPALDLVVGDFNGDGIPDLAVAAGKILILLGQGHGVFGPPIATTTKNPAVALVAGNFNNDGKLDLAVDTQIPLGHARYSLIAFRGNGDGTFGAAQPILGDYSTTRLLVHDLNADGFDDIVDGNEILYGNGNGTFQQPVPYPSEEGSGYWTALADVNGDGHIDILSANSTGDISISLGSGHGVFQQPYSYIAGVAPLWIGAANFLGHGFSDIVAIAEDSLELFPDTADGKYGAEPTIDLNQTALGNPVLADFNGDGNPDAAVLAYNAPISILLGNGKGGFTVGTPAQAGPASYALVTGDFNGDGKPDLAVADGQTNLIYILLGNGDGTFSAGATLPVPPSSCTSFSTCYVLATADLTNNGKLDLLIMGLNTTGVDTSFVEAFLGNGDGTFGGPLSVATGFNFGLAIGDFNGDGYPDLVVEGVSNTELYLGNGNGTFQSPVSIYGQAVPAAVGDFKGNGNLDVVLINPQGALVVLLGNGHAAFQQGQIISSFDGFTVTVADLNGDGYLDLLASSSQSKLLTIYLGKGDGTFAQQTGAGISCVSIIGCGAAIGDVNGDGKPDIFSIQIGNEFAVSPIAVLFNTTH